jgi:cytochrome bd-type quinol oxidase subunit 2
MNIKTFTKGGETMQKLTKAFTSIGLLALLFLVFAPSNALAVTFNTNDVNGTTLPTKDLKSSITSIIGWALTFLGLIAVIMIIYGGFMWLTAAGNEERISKAKQIISAAIIGLIIILLAAAIVYFIGQGVNTAATN